ncbi:hypothetical protein MUK42_08063 [Musa troglodytarum]|uniref:IBH1-like N-terminal domain-containing protein n=1 Tax=Musa troglodytarum TaxID=320322 RepID=A0A9E7L3K2_9LILI|nr:hypothetical protein MUK42_08063 [Musa troglodytarum]
MQATKSFEQAFLRHLLRGFRLSAVSYKSMSLQERKSAIKLSADVAMASARGSRKWTRGLITKLSREDEHRSFLRLILGTEYGRLTKPRHGSWKIPRSKKIVRRSLRVCSRRKNNLRAPHGVKSGVLARTLVEKRTHALKRLVPGGESLDGCSLLDEALDYVISLRAQVDLMQKLLTTFEAPKLRALSKCTLPERKASFVGK